MQRLRALPSDCFLVAQLHSSSDPSAVVYGDPSMPKVIRQIDHNGCSTAADTSPRAPWPLRIAQSHGTRQAQEGSTLAINLAFLWQFIRSVVSVAGRITNSKFEMNSLLRNMNLDRLHHDSRVCFFGSESGQGWLLKNITPSPWAKVGSRKELAVRRIQAKVDFSAELPNPINHASIVARILL